MSKRILFLDDDPYLRRHIAESLREEQYIVDECRGIDEAIEYIENYGNGLDCIIADLHMNGGWLPPDCQADTDGYLMTGWVWLRQYVWSRPELENIPCVIYSGFTKDLLDVYLKKRGELNLIKDYNLHFVDKGGRGPKHYTSLKQTLERIFLGK